MIATCEHFGIAYHTDAANSDPVYVRARIRAALPTLLRFVSAADLSELARISQQLVEERSERLEPWLTRCVRVDHETGTALLALEKADSLLLHKRWLMVQLFTHIVRLLRGPEAPLPSIRSIAEAVQSIHEYRKHQRNHKVTLSGCVAQLVSSRIVNRSAFSSPLPSFVPAGHRAEAVEYIFFQRSADNIPAVPLPYNEPVVWDHRWRITAHTLLETSSETGSLPSLVVSRSPTPPALPSARQQQQQQHRSQLRKHQRTPEGSPILRCLPQSAYLVLPAIFDTETNTIVHAHAQPAMRRPPHPALASIRFTVEFLPLEQS